MKRNLLLLTVILAALTLVPSLVLAQDEGEEPLLVCDDFVNSAPEERASYYMGEGAGFFSAGYYDLAIYSYSCIIQQVDENFLGAYMQRAAAFTARRDYESAIEDYTQAIAIDANNIAAYNNRGIVYAARQEYEEALADFNHILELDANYIRAYNNRAVIAAVTGDYDTAIADLEHAIEISGIGDIYAELTDPERPAGAQTPAFDSEPAQSYALLGIIYSAWALDNYEAYLYLRGSQADQRIQSAAGALESRFSFELRLDDGTWLLSADLSTSGEALP